jgi:sarcosine oxidase subunit gamma
MPESASRVAPLIPASEWLRPLPPAARFVLYAEAEARALAAGVWGVPLSADPLRALVQGTRASLWLGPDEYLLIASGVGDAEPDAASGLAAQLEAALGAVPHALVDVSHRQFALEVNGPHAITLLSAACPLDLDAREFPVGMCTRTVFAKADIVLWRTRTDAFHMEVWRSFADYVGGLLHEIAREFHPA